MVVQRSKQLETVNTLHDQWNNLRRSVVCVEQIELFAQPSAQTIDESISHILETLVLLIVVSWYPRNKDLGPVTIAYVHVYTCTCRWGTVVKLAVENQNSADFWEVRNIGNLGRLYTLTLAG